MEKYLEVDYGQLPEYNGYEEVVTNETIKVEEFSEQIVNNGGRNEIEGELQLVEAKGKQQETDLEQEKPKEEADGDLEETESSGETTKKSRTKPTILSLPTEIFPLIYPYLDMKEIFNCRQVCHRWKCGVDKTLLNTPPDRDRNIQPIRLSPHHEFPQYKLSLLRKGFGGKYFDTSVSISIFMSNLEPFPTAKAFLLGGVHFGPGTWDYEYWDQVYRLLGEHGTNILHVSLNVNIGADIYKYQKEYQILCQCLKLTPNLKTLTVSGFIFNNALLMHPGTIDRDPLPTLPKLEILTIKDLQSPLIAQKLLMAYSQQLKKLTNLSVDEPTYGIPLHWPDIQELRMIVSRRSDMVGYLFFRQFLAPNLKKLSVISYERFHITRFLFSLKGLDSIEVLNMHSYFGFEVSFGMLNDVFVLPRVKKLEIKDMLEIPYEILFTHLPNVEELVVYLEWRHVAPREPRIQMHDFEAYNASNWMRASHAGVWNWAKMPKLKRIVFAFLNEEDDMQLSVYTVFDRPVCQTTTSEPAIAGNQLLVSH